MHNVTIDDTNTTAITYTPELCEGAGWYKFDNPNSYFGSYRLCGNIGANRPSATFNFMGTAIYYMFFGANQTLTPMLFTLDDLPTEVVSLPNNTQTTSDQVAWYKADLENTEHSLHIVPQDNYFVYVDSFVFTSLDDSDLPLVASPPTTTPASFASATFTNAQAAQSSFSGVSSEPVESSTAASSTGIYSKGHATIALGVTFGIVTLLLFGFVVFYLRKRFRRNVHPGAWGAGESRFHIDPLSPCGGFDSNTFVRKVHSAKSPYSSNHNSTASIVPDPVYDYGFRHLQGHNAGPATLLQPVSLSWTPPFEADSTRDASMEVPLQGFGKSRPKTEIQFTPPPRYTLAIVNYDTL